MKAPYFLSTSLKVYTLLLSVLVFSCTPKKDSGGEQISQETKQPEKVICEVEMTASNLKNALLAPSENIKFTVLKLHELAEDHHHERITEQAAAIADESVKLMNSSAYLSTYYLDSLISYCTQCAVLANSLKAHNQSMSKAKLVSTMEQLEKLSESISTYTGRKIKMEKDVCLTHKEMLENQIRLYYHTINSGIKSINASLGSSCADCLTKEVSFYESIMKSFRESLIKAPTSQYKTVSRSLADLEHSIHELTTLHEAEEAHHAMETIERQMGRLEDELLDITGKNEL